MGTFTLIIPRKGHNMYSGKVASLVLVVVLSTVIITDAQKCMDRMCGKLYCPMISETGCPIQSQDDCADGEVYLYPGLICECCGACLSRSLTENARCGLTIMNEHTAGCATGLCCSDSEVCVAKTSEFGAP